jgi:hypothetical protein
MEYNRFRMAAIPRGNGQRFVDRTAASADAAFTASKAASLAQPGGLRRDDCLQRGQTLRAMEVDLALRLRLILQHMLTHVVRALGPVSRKHSCRIETIYPAGPIGNQFQFLRENT